MPAVTVHYVDDTTGPISITNPNMSYDALDTLRADRSYGSNGIVYLQGVRSDTGDYVIGKAVKVSAITDVVLH